MLLRLLLAFTVVPLVELALLLYLADLIGWQYTVGLVLATGVLGASLARWQGTQVWRRVHQKLATGELPADAMLDGLMILVAGVLLVTPGVLTDIVGFGLLLPPVRTGFRRWLKARFSVQMQFTPPPDFRADHAAQWRGGDAPPHDQIVDTRVIDTSGEQIEPDE